MRDDSSRIGQIANGWTRGGSGSEEDIVPVDFSNSSAHKQISRDLLVTLCECGCGEDAELKCSNCKKVYYMDKKCQKRNW